MDLSFALSSACESPAGTVADCSTLMIHPSAILRAAMVLLPGVLALPAWSPMRNILLERARSCFQPFPPPDS